MRVCEFRCLQFNAIPADQGSPTLRPSLKTIATQTGAQANDQLHSDGQTPANCAPDGRFGGRGWCRWCCRCRTAARQRLKVTLIERYGFCGGGAVAGLSGTICGIYEASDNSESAPKQLVHGFLDEFVANMSTRGGLTPPVRYGKTFTRVHDPLVWRETADAMLDEAGVQVLLHTTVTDALVEAGEKIDGIVAYTKQGRLSVRAKVTVDASGDADVAAMAGFSTSIGRDGTVQNPTMIFRLSGVDTEKFLARYGPDAIMGREIAELIQRLHNSHEYHLPRAKIFLFPTPRPNELLCNSTRILGRDGRELNPLLIEDLTEAEIEGRRQVREYARFFKDRLTGCEESFVNDTGVQIGVRQTRQLRGRVTLRNEDVTRGAKFADGIARSPWPIELHSGDRPQLIWLMNTTMKSRLAVSFPNAATACS
jgi:hypothetical protein